MPSVRGAYTTLTTDQHSALKDIARLAGLIVLETARKRPFGGRMAYVRRVLIEQLEAALVAAGYDMTAARTQMRTFEKELNTEVQQQMRKA